MGILWTAEEGAHLAGQGGVGLHAEGEGVLEVGEGTVRGRGARLRSVSVGFNGGGCSEEPAVARRRFSV